MKQIDTKGNKALAFSRLLVILCCVALIVTYTAINFLIQQDSTTSFWLMKVIPLALFLPALYAGKQRSYQWLCFLIMIYFIQAILDIFSTNETMQGIVETFLTLLLFCAAIFYLHGSHKQIKLNQKNTQEFTQEQQHE